MDITDEQILRILELARDRAELISKSNKLNYYGMVINTSPMIRKLIFMDTLNTVDRTFSTIIYSGDK